MPRRRKNAWDPVASFKKVVREKDLAKAIEIVGDMKNDDISGLAALTLNRCRPLPSSTREVRPNES